MKEKVLFIMSNPYRFIGRKKEINLVHEIQNDDSSHFLAIYGRRRVGKTFLIREAFDYRFAFQHAGLSEG